MKSILIILLFISVYSQLPNVEMSGRWLQIGNQYLADWPGVSLNFQLTGASYLQLQLGDNNLAKTYGVDKIQYKLDIWEDGDHYGFIMVYHTQNLQVVKIADRIIPSQLYNFTIIKVTEADEGDRETGTIGPWIMKSILTDGRIILPAKEKVKFLFFGDSITAGYGTDGVPPCGYTAETANNDHAYGRYVAEYYGAEYQVIAKGGMGVIRNAGDTTNSEITMIDLYNRTLCQTDKYIWDEQSFVPDYISINLGTNDYGLEPYPDTDEFIQTFVHFVVNTLAMTYPSSRIVLGCGPIYNETRPLCNNVQTVVTYSNYILGVQNNRVKYADLQNILTDNDYGCGGHPDYKGERKMANLVIEKLNEWIIKE